MTKTKAWLFLLLAILMEVVGTVAMKLAAGFTYLLPSIFIFICYGISIFFLTLALKRFEIGFAYAIWSALGTLLICVVSVELFQEGLTILKAMSLFFIVVGVAGLKQE